jgi:hypothetical protein
MRAIVSTLLQDLRYGLRMALRSPSFTAVAALTLAIGIAVNTTVFGWVDMMLSLQCGGGFVCPNHRLAFLAEANPHQNSDVCRLVVALRPE